LDTGVELLDVLAMDDGENYGDGELSLGPLLGQSAYTDLNGFVVANRGKLIVSHVNCNHLLPHINEMRIMYQNSSVDVIGVNETFLVEAIHSDAVEIQGYVFLRNDRTVLGRPNTQGGGVGIYLKSGLKYRILAKSKEIGLEFIFVEIIVNSKKLLIASIYRPPSSSIVYQNLASGDYGLQSLEDILSELLPLYNEIFLFGDFNINLLSKNDPLFNMLNDIMTIFMLYNVSVLPTRAASGF
jgi:exonuclease III